MTRNPSPMIIGVPKSAKVVTKTSRAPVEIDGTISGRITVRKAPRRVRPRLMAASSRLWSIVLKPEETSRNTNGKALRVKTRMIPGQP